MNLLCTRHARRALAVLGIVCAAAASAVHAGPVPTGGGPPGCCTIGTGGYDLQGSQAAQIPDPFGCDPATSNFAFEAADDFYLCPGKIYQITSITATMATNQLAILQKPNVRIYEDCNGSPGAEIVLTNFLGPPPPVPFDDRPVITVAQGGPYGGGLNLVTVTATFPNLWLRGGKSYWVSFYGTSCIDTQWAWTTGGLGFIQGKPAMARSRAGLPNYTPWRTLDECCLGCTDLAFCVTAEECKVLLDNGTYSTTPIAGAKSLENGAITQFSARAAADFVVPPCDPMEVCFIEAYIITNCLIARLDIYEGGCELPASNSPLYTLTPKRYVHTGQFISVNGEQLEVICLQFWGDTVVLPGGRTYWLSAYGLGTGSLSQQAYFAYNAPNICNPCPIKFAEGAVRGPGYNQPNWKHIFSVLGVHQDFAFMIAVHNDSTNGGAATPSCVVDFDRDGNVDIDDVFMYINAWMTGCP